MKYGLNGVLQLTVQHLLCERKEGAGLACLIMRDVLLLRAGKLLADVGRIAATDVSVPQRRDFVRRADILRSDCQSHTGNVEEWMILMRS